MFFLGSVQNANALNFRGIFLLKRNVDVWVPDLFGPVFAVVYLLLRKECF